jgi:acyl-CoA reductase-like NAD-dependent aldehyde dehydrogenase
VQRVLVHEAVAEELIDALVAQADALSTGDPLDESTDVGPLIDDAQTERVLQWIEEAVDLGASVAAGGKRDGVALRPTVLTGVSPQARVSREEVFGPVLVVTTYRDFDEALARANDTHLALHAGVFTSDVSKAMKAASILDFGGVHINDIPTFRADQQPYGGLREAGNTREGPRYTVREMTELRVVWLPP